jgi:hypothetical protein
MRAIGSTAVLIFAVCFGSTAAADCARYDGGASELHGLSIAATSLNVRADDPKAPQFVTTLGTLTNSGTSCFSDVTVEVKYFDSKGELIDSVTEDLESIVVAAGQEVAFRTMAPPARRREEYASQTVRVLTARETPAALGPNQPRIEAKARELLYAFGPVVLLVLVWWFFIKFQQRNKRSPQNRTLAILERHTALLESKNELLGRIATALEQRSKI